MRMYSTGTCSGRQGLISISYQGVIQLPETREKKSDVPTLEDLLEIEAEEEDTKANQVRTPSRISLGSKK